MPSVWNPGNEKARIKHRKVCIRTHKEYHGFHDCPFNKKHRCVCGNFTWETSCGKCHTIGRKKARFAKVALIGQMFPFNTEISIKPEALLAVGDMLEDRVASIEDRVARQVANAAVTVSATVDDQVAKISQAVQDVLKTGSGTFLEILTKLVTGLTLVWRTRHDTFTWLLSIASLLLGLGVTSVVVDWFRSLVATEIKRSDANLVGQSDFPVISLVLVFIHLLVFGSKPNMTTVALFLASVSRLDSQTKGVRTLWESACAVFENLTRWFKITVLGYVPEELTTELDPIVEWSQRVDEMFVGDDRKKGVWTLSAVQQLDELHNMGLEIRKNNATLRAASFLQYTFSSRMTILQKMLDEVASSGARQQPRIEPYMVYIWGASGLGKSLITPFLASHFLATFHPDLFKKRDIDYTASTFVRNPGDPRWDGVGAHKVYVYDDYGQARDSQANPNSEFLETIRLANSTPYIPEMAELGKKGRIQLAPELLLHSSNVQQPAIYSLTHPEAVYRRFDMILYVKPHSACDNGNGLLDLEKLRVRHTMRECGCTNNTDICENAVVFQRQAFVAATNQYVHVGDSMSLADVCKIMIMEARDIREKKGARREFFKHLMRNLVGQMNIDSNTDDDSEGGYSTPRVRIKLNRVVSTDDDSIDMTTSDSSASIDSGGKKRGRIVSARSILQADPRVVKWLDELAGDDLVLRKAYFVEFYNSGKPDWSMLPPIEPSPSRFVKWYEQVEDLAKSSAVKFATWIKEHPVAACLSAIGATGMLGYMVFRAIFPREPVPLDITCMFNDSEDASTAKSTIKQKVLGEGGSQNGKTKRSLRRSVWAEDGFRLEDNTEMELQGSTDGNLFAVQRKAYKSQYLLSVGGKKIGSGLMIKGRVMMTFGHWRSYNFTEITFTNIHTGINYTVDVSQLKMELMEVDGNSIDVLLMQMPRIFPCGADLSNLFVDDEQIVSHSTLDVRLVTPRGNMVIMHAGKARAADQVIKYSNLGGDVVLRHFYAYEFDTAGGDCGSPLYVVGPHLAGKLIGMHVAGASGLSYGISVAISRQLIIKFLSKFELEGQIAIPIDEMELDDTMIRSDLIRVGGLGRARSGPVDNIESSIEESPMHGWDGPPIKKPAMLTGQVDGEYVRDKARAKLAWDGCSVLNQEFESVAKQMVENLLMDQYHKRDIWPLEVAAFGDDENKYRDSVDMNTSPGWPWKATTTKKGKKGLLNYNTQWIRDDLRSAVITRETRGKAGKRMPVLWSDHYKDETRLVAGDKFTKPRLFSAAPLDYTLLMRQYFGSFCESVMSGRIKNGVCVGINPHGFEWTVLAQHILAKGNHIYCGDFSNYDGTLHPQLMWVVCDIINAWYDDASENQLLRTVMFEDIVNAVHITRNHVYVMDHGNPSGNPLTAILNSIYQLLAFFYVLLSMGFSVAEIEAKFVLCTYGDDNIGSVTGGSDTLDLTELCEAFKRELNMTLTSSDKFGKPSYRSIGDADFLSRGFRFEEGRYFAPRPWPNLSLIFHWKKGRLHWDDISRDYLECVVFELSHYGRIEFGVLVDRLIKEYRKRNFKMKPVRSIDHYRAVLVDELPRAFFLCFDI